MQQLTNTDVVPAVMALALALSPKPGSTASSEILKENLIFGWGGQQGSIDMAYNPEFLLKAHVNVYYVPDMPCVDFMF